MTGAVAVEVKWGELISCLDGTRQTVRILHVLLFG